MKKLLVTGTFFCLFFATISSQNIYNLVMHLIKDGEINLDMDDIIVKDILVTHDNKIVHSGTREAMGL